MNTRKEIGNRKKRKKRKKERKHYLIEGSGKNLVIAPLMQHHFCYIDC